MTIRLSLVVAAMLATPLFAQSGAPTAAPKPEKIALVQNMTCGDLLFMLGDENQTQDSTYLIFWAYGLKTGASGSDLEKYPLTIDGIKVFVGDLYDTCKTKSDAKVVDLLTGKAEK